MEFFLFVCFIVSGVVASNKEITDIHRGDAFLIELGLNTNPNNGFKDQNNLKYENNYDNMESK